MQNKIKNVLMVGSLLAAGGSVADSGFLGTGKVPVPRGPQIEALAGNCGIGPFKQTSKAGQYNGYCDVLSDAEKCAALIKQHLKYNGGTYPAYHKEKVEHCLDHLAEELLELGEEN